MTELVILRLILLVHELTEACFFMSSHTVGLPGGRQKEAQAYAETRPHIIWNGKTNMDEQKYG